MENNEYRGILKDNVDNIKSLWSQAFSKEHGGISVSEFFGSFKTSFKNLMTKITSKLWNPPESRRGDGVYVPADQKTLLGDDFANLYTGEVGTKTVETTDGNLQCLNPNSPYAITMHPSCLFSENKATYGALTPTEKAAYEVVLVTKKLANQYDGSNADDIANQYNDIMCQYKDYCESNHIEWRNVQNKVSNEFQAESAGFRSLADKKNLYLANLSHNLFLKNAGPDYQDPICNYVGWVGYSYDDTLSLDNFEGMSSWKAVLAGKARTASDYFLYGTSKVHGLAQEGIAAAQDKISEWQESAENKAENSTGFKAKVWEEAGKQLGHLSGSDKTEQQVNKFISEFGTDYSTDSDTNTTSYENDEVC